MNNNKIDFKVIFIILMLFAILIINSIIDNDQYKRIQTLESAAAAETEVLTGVSRDDILATYATIVETETAPELIPESEDEPEETIIETEAYAEKSDTEETIVWVAPESVKEAEAPVIESVSTTLAQSGTQYLGTFMITGYSAEAGFPAGQTTHSGVPVGPGICAMDYWQRIYLGIEWGEQLYIEGLGTFTVYDSGCPWGIVDIWVETNEQAYAITEYYDVYLLR